jgi:hypothetical protein
MAISPARMAGLICFSWIMSELLFLTLTPAGPRNQSCVMQCHGLVSELYRLACFVSALSVRMNWGRNL